MFSTDLTDKERGLGGLAKTRIKGDPITLLRESPVWGRYLMQIPSEEGLDKEAMSSFALNPNFQRVPGALWVRWIRLALHVMKELGNGEVSVRFTAKVVDGHTIWRCWVPKQKISPGSVNATFDVLRDIETGEEIKQWPPEGEEDRGSSHSHNTMNAFFSQTDNESELSSPGMHIVIGKLSDERYTHEASIVQSKRRFTVPLFSLISEYAPDCANTFHPSVMELITKQEFGGYRLDDGEWPEHWGMGGIVGGNFKRYRDGDFAPFRPSTDEGGPTLITDAPYTYNRKGKKVYGKVPSGPTTGFELYDPNRHFKVLNELYMILAYPMTAADYDDRAKLLRELRQFFDLKPSSLGKMDAAMRQMEPKA